MRCRHFYDEYDVVVSVAIISRLLQEERRWSKKETAKRAAERSEYEAAESYHFETLSLRIPILRKGKETMYMCGDIIYANKRMD